MNPTRKQLTELIMQNTDEIMLNEEYFKQVYELLKKIKPNKTNNFFTDSRGYYNYLVDVIPFKIALDDKDYLAAKSHLESICYKEWLFTERGYYAVLNELKRKFTK